MKPETRRFRVELAINLHAAPIPQTNPNLRLFPLQNALVDVSRGDHRVEPAWYSRLGFGDEISFRLVDLSRRRVPSCEPDYPSLVLAELFFANPSTGRPTNPFTEPVVQWRLSPRLDDRPSPVYSLHPTDPLPTWNLVARTAGGEDREWLRFAGGGDRETFRAYELTVVFKMRRDGWIDHYVFDPEMIVSETDNEGDGSGGKSG